MKNFEIGEEIETTVVQISNDTVFIDLGLKSEGFVDKAEFLDEEGNCTINEGDKIKVYYVSTNRDELHFTTKLKGENAGNELLEKAFQTKLPIEGHVEKEIKGGFEVKIGTTKAFCPYSQMGYKNREELSAYIGKTLPFVITEYKNEGKNIIISNRQFLEDEENSKVLKLSSQLVVDTIVEGTVKSIQSYGAFVDVQGFQTLLPISEISHTRIKDVSEILSIGQKIKAKIINADWNTAKPDRSKISISMKALEKDPWEVNSQINVGEKISGKIARITSFGLFVNLKPGIDGLVHISDIENASLNTNLNKLFKVEDTFDVIVEKVDVKEKRISLKPASSVEQDKEAEKYMSNQSEDDGDTYNPFAALLKK